MATAKKLPSGEWRIQKYIGKDDSGKRIYKYFTAPTKKEVEYQAAEYCIEYEREKKLHKNNYATLTVYQAMELYMESKSNVLAPSTLNGYNIILRNRFLDLRNTELGNLTNLMIQNSINREAKKLSPKSLANASGFLSAVLNQYYPDFHYNVTLPAKKKKIKDLPDPTAIISVVKDTNVELPVLLAMWLSLRMSEVRGLRRQDITTDGYIILNQTKVFCGNEEHIRDKAKTEGSTRKLRLPTYIVDLIALLPETQEYLVPEKPQTITKRFYKLLRDNGIEHMTFHELRHLNASVMVKLKIPNKYAMERGGWSTPAVLESVYQHTFSDERKAVDDQIDDYFNSIIK